MTGIKLSEADFDAIVQKAVANIPPQISKYFDNIVISVRKRPTNEMLREVGLDDRASLLGLFQGTPLIERSVVSPPLYPDMIFLFQEPLEEACGTLEELQTQIEITVVHEVAHFVGMTEEELAALGYG